MTFYETIKLLEGKTIKVMDCTKTGDFKTISIETTCGHVLKIYAAVSQPFNNAALQVSIDDSEREPK